MLPLSTSRSHITRRCAVLGLSGIWMLAVLSLHPATRVGAQTSSQSVPQLPAKDWPSGWKPFAPYPEELTFVPPHATTKVAEATRTLTSDITSDKTFKGGVTSNRIIIDNPYLNADDPFFNIPRQIACLADGSVAVASTAKLHADGRFKGNPYASGFWRIAPDGAITALAAKHIRVERSAYPTCGVPFAKSSIDPDVKPMTVMRDGSLLFSYPHSGALLRLATDGRVEHVPARQDFCAASAKAPAEPFGNPQAAVEDPRGNVWVSGSCALWRMAPDDTVTKVLGAAEMCPAGEPERWVLGDFMAWDTVHDELVMSGGHLWLKSPKEDFYSIVHRVTPDGVPRRVFLGVKAGRSAPNVDGISGLALDRKGTIHFGAGVTTGSGYQVMRLDEAKGVPIVVAGAPRPGDMNHRDGPARQAHFGTFRSMCFAPDSTLYINDANHVIRKLTPGGQVTTWAF
jgi:hypothetical protein